MPADSGRRVIYAHLMVEQHDVETSGSKFSQVLNVAARLPSVRIDREKYLRAALRHKVSPEQLEQAIRKTPAAAGIERHIIAEVASVSIRYETSKATGLSALAGLPGGLLMVGTVPADMAQYVGHMLRVSQKLAYLNSWPALFEEGEDVDEATEGVLTLFVGVMLGVQVAQSGVTRVAAMIAAQVAKKLPQQALTKGVLFPLVRKVAAVLGVQMTKKLFAGGVAKAIPVVGAAISGGLTLSTFLPMSKRLAKHLAALPLAEPADPEVSV